MFGERVLLLIPHPDDELVGMATAIARLQTLGGRAFGAYLTSGVPRSAGSWFGGQFKYARAAERRWVEAKTVAEKLGLSIVGRQPVPARCLKDHLLPSLHWVRDHAKKLDADRVWVPAYEGGHQDHDVTNFIGSRLALSNEVWEFSEYNYAEQSVRSQTFINENGSETIIHLDDQESENKRQLLSMYRSERKNLHHIRLERESSRPLVSYDYRSAPHGGPCFYERFHWVPFHPRIDYCRSQQVCRVLGDFLSDVA